MNLTFLALNQAQRTLEKPHCPDGLGDMKYALHVHIYEKVCAKG